MIDRSKTPQIHTLSVPELLEYNKLTLDNGIEIIYINDPNQQVFKIDIVFEAGTIHQKSSLIASTAISMLNEGTSKYNAQEIAECFDYHGAYLDFNCGFGKSELSLISLSKYADECISMLTEMLTDSIIPEKELEIYLSNKRQEFLVSLENVAYLSRKKFGELYFGEDHPLANKISENDFKHVKREDIIDFYREHINAKGCRVFVCGDVNDQLITIISKQLSRLTTPDIKHSNSKKELTPAHPQRYHVSKDNSVQTSIRIGKSGVHITHDDYAHFLLLNTILGGYFGSRLMSSIREDKGFTYGISSFNVTILEHNYWGISTDVNSENTEETIEEIIKEIKLLQDTPVTDDELTLVKRYLQGELLRELDGVFSQSDSLKHKINHNMDNTFYHRLIEKLKTCTAQEIQNLAKKYLNTEEMYIVTVGK